MPVDAKYNANYKTTLELTSWHMVEIVCANNYNKQFHEHLAWLDDNVSLKDWRLPGDLQYNNKWVYKFLRKEDAVRFALVWG